MFFYIGSYDCINFKYFTVSLDTIILNLILKHLYYMNYEASAMTEPGGL